MSGEMVHGIYMMIVLASMRCDLTTNVKGSRSSPFTV